MLVAFLTSGCSGIAGQDFTHQEKYISEFDLALAEKVVNHFEQPIAALSIQQNLSKDEYFKYQDDIQQMFGKDMGREIAMSFFDAADIENSNIETLERTLSIIYPLLSDGTAYIDSADIVEYRYRDDLVGTKTYLKVTELSSDEKLSEFKRTYLFEQIDNEWCFSHIEGTINYAYDLE